MTHDTWDEDDALLAEVGQVLRENFAAPHRMLEIARGLFSWRTIDDDLERLSLTEDSSEFDPALVRSSGVVARRLLNFSGGDTSIEIEVNDGSITGQLVPPGHAEVTLVVAAGWSTRTDTDEYGCFRFQRPVSGAVIRLRCVSGADSVVTEWMAI